MTSPEEGPRLHVLLSTIPDIESGARLARTLVEESLAACVNLVPGVRSIFRWEGAIEDASEVLMVMKASADAIPALISRVEALHPYDVPEVLALEVADGAESYLEWVEAASGGRAGR